jgi:hypothetical protein
MKVYRGGSAYFKQQEYTNSTRELEMNEQKLASLMKGGSNKKTKRKQQNVKQQVRRVYSRVHTKKRRHTRKKDDKKHRR